MKRVKVKDTEVSCNYKLDIESELSKILSDELSRQIDNEILKSLGIVEKQVNRKYKIQKILKLLNNSR